MHLYWNILCNTFNAFDWFLPEENLKNKDFTLLTQIFKLLAWAPKAVMTYIKVT